MSESQEVVATVLTDKEELPEFLIPINGADIHAITKHVASIEVQDDAHMEPLVMMLSRLAQIFVKRNDDFSIHNFIVQCDFSDDKKSAAIIAANALSLKAGLRRKIAPEDVEMLAQLTLAALSSPPLPEILDDTLEGAMSGAPMLKVGDFAFITKASSRYCGQGPFPVTEVNIRTNVVKLKIGTIEQDYKSFNLRKA